MHDLDATIVAVATPPGRGGVGCVRLSGPKAEAIAGSLFEPAAGRLPRPGGRPRFGRFLDREGSPLDHGYLLVFTPEGAYTGEPAAELWTHGSPAVLAALVDAAIGRGAAPAGPGEFTYRALRRGKLDLARAEAVRDLVHARTLYQARVAFAQAEGAVSRRVRPLRETLEEWIARAEAAVEFVDESETHLPPGSLGEAIAGARAACRELLDGFRTGRLVRDGASLVIVGRPNAGKSSLFNRLLARERAIVTDVPGTTRDTLEEQLDLEGIPVRLVDTAGLRSVADPVELEGVRRTRQAREEADLVLLVLDGSRDPDPVEREERQQVSGGLEAGRTVVVMNKCDLERARGGGAVFPDLPRVCALTGEGVDELRLALRRCLVGTGPLENPVITDARHAAALEGALAVLDRAAEAHASGLTEELVLEDLREARTRLGEITGEYTTEALYDRIFSTFCIGK